MTWLSRLLPQSKGLQLNTSDFNRRIKSRRRRMALENLEDRVVLSNVGITFDPTSGILNLYPDQYNNQFRITESPTSSPLGGRVTVDALPFLGGTYQTSLNGTGVTTWTSWEAVTQINVYFTGGNDTDVVQLQGTAGANNTVRNVNYYFDNTLGTTSFGVTPMGQVSGVTNVSNDGTFAINGMNGALGTATSPFKIDNTSFQALTITQGGSNISNVAVTNTTVIGNTNINLNTSGKSTLVVGSTGGNLNFGPTVLAQGNGAGDSITVQGKTGTTPTSTIQRLNIVQGTGSGDQVKVDSIALSKIDVGLTVIQAGSASATGNTVDVSNITTLTTTPAPGMPAPPPSAIPSILVTQGAGNTLRTTINNAKVEGDIKITQTGGTYRETAQILNSQAGFVVAANPPFVPTPQVVKGLAQITQGNGTDLVAEVTGGSFNDVSITQGNGTIPPPSPATPQPNKATVQNLTQIYRNITIQQSNTGSVAGQATISNNAASTTGVYTINQMAASSANMLATISNSSAYGGFSVWQGNGANDKASITGSNATDGSVFVQQGNGGNDGVTITSVVIDKGDVTVTQGNGGTDTVAITSLTASSGNVRVQQGNGANDKATLTSLTVPLGGVSAQQGTGGSSTISLTSSNIGTLVPFGSYVMGYLGDVSLTQLGGDSNTVTVGNNAKVNSLSITQGDSAIGGGTVDVNGTPITGDLTITQGGSSSLGGYLIDIASGNPFTGVSGGNVSVGGTTSITQNGANNSIYMGNVLGGSSSFITYAMNIAAGNGGAFVAAAAVTVLDYFGFIDATGGGNSFWDGGNNVGLYISPNFSILSF